MRTSRPLVFVTASSRIARNLGDPAIELIFAHERLTTHAVLVQNLRRLMAAADFVICFTDGINLNVSFEAGLAVGLGKPLVLAILPGARSMPATFVGQCYVELHGNAEDRDELRGILASIVAGRALRLPRFGCAGAEVV
jgi:nucleoside 2-deoxyribosyltransferase